MEAISEFLLYVMALLYIAAGINHFRSPRFYLSITPSWVPVPEKMNLLVGIIEIVLAIGLLLPSTQSIAAWGIIVLLILIFPANFYHYQKEKRKGRHVTTTLIRLPIQLLLMYWAYLYT